MNEWHEVREEPEKVNSHSGKQLSKWLVCALACIFVFCAQSVAHSAPADSIIFDAVTATAGRSAVLTARLHNANTMTILSLPLIYPAADISLDSISWVSTRDGLSTMGQEEIDLAAGRAQLALVAIAEPFISPGEGIFAELYFSIDPDAADGTRAVIDTAMYPPNGYVLARTPDHTDLPLGFVPGVFNIVRENQPPVLEVDAWQFGVEGQELRFAVGVTDADDDSLIVSVSGAPTTATMTATGVNTYEFSWTPDYLGATSSAASPFMVTFHVTDGETPVSKTVEIRINNVNRSPEMSLPPPAHVIARDSVLISIEAVDPDGGPLSFASLQDFDHDSTVGDNPWTYSWQTSDADVGSHELRFACEDEYGAADTITVEVTVAEVQAYRLTIESVSGEAGATALVPVELANLNEIGGFDLLIHYDPSAMVFDGVERAGLGTESWESFEISEITDVTGRNIRLTGIADLDDGVSSPVLPPSDTTLFNLKFILADETEFFGLSSPVYFNLGEPTDNILQLPDGTTVIQTKINYVSGEVLIEEPAGLLIGDINLNGVAFEVGDAVRFTNFFTYGSQLDPVQRANSDCNRDGTAASLADLVYLIGILTESITP